jgi:hypothetical protein
MNCEAPLWRPVRLRCKCVRNFSDGLFPDVGRLCVIIPLCTENWLRFSAILDEGAPEVRFERAVAGEP